MQPEEMMKPIEAQHACGLSLKRLKLKASPSSMSDVDFADCYAPMQAYLEPLQDWWLLFVVWSPMDHEFGASLGATG